MPRLEIRRHSHRKPGGGSQLSQAGVDAARRLGDSLGPFVRVVTTVVPRTRETALAMGFAVDHELVSMVSDRRVYEEMARIDFSDGGSPFAHIARLIEDGGAFSQFAHATAAAWRDLLTPLGADDSVLVIGHSGELESGLVACFPDADHATWGSAFDPLEGAVARFDGEPAHFSAVEFLRGGA